MKIKRPILLPFSPLYGFITWLRNRLFDSGILKSRKFNIPIISVGNLNVGGTGKTPHSKYIIQYLNNHKKIALLSRGYGRDTKGFQLASNPPDCSVIGDEPAEIKTRFPDLTVAVDEKRAHGIDRLLHTFPDLDGIVLDDAFQHRYIQPKLSILLTAQNDLFSDDWHLPGGNLREFSIGKKRAEVVVVTKCDKHLSDSKQQGIARKLKLNKNQHLFFSYFSYQQMVNNAGDIVESPKRFLLVTGIANPKYLIDYFEDQEANFLHLSFKDHHHFSDANYREMQEVCEKHGISTIVTTVKDYMRFNIEHSALVNYDILQLPITIKFIKDEEKFQKIVFNAVSLD